MMPDVEVLQKRRKDGREGVAPLVESRTRVRPTAGSPPPAECRVGVGYRGDIDGLRAISVLLVILFHLGFAPASGGFIGVDVFFVISGYLITGIIYDALRVEQFSFVRFYERRARRILPALLAVILVSWLAGYILLYPGDYKTFSLSAIYAILAASNFYFFLNTGYFDLPSQVMPLLHTWSLGVEEQFYIAWPAIMLAAHKIFHPSPAAWRRLLYALILASFAAAALGVTHNPKAAFYLPHTRAWELAVGALLVFTPRLPVRLSWLREPLPLAGLASIALSALILDAQSPFPGFNALAPVLGAAFVIYWSGRPSLVHRILAVQPMAFVGLISYSLYL